MATAELPITSQYLPKWKTWEGLREVVQNALDEEVQNGHEAKIYYCEETSTVTVSNKGATLDPRAFLFGHTTKADDARTIGEYGEGLKLGVLALVREGYVVRIAVGADVWTARFLNSRKYKAKILAFDIDKGAFPDNEDVTVTITGVSAADYFDTVKRFLKFYPGVVDRVGNSSYYGYMLPEAQFRGKVFVKGVWVQDVDGLEFGYDFGTAVKLNRDRDFLSGWDISWYAAYIIDTALKDEDCPRDLLVRVYNILESESGVEGEQLAGKLSMESKTKLAGLFRERHGDKAVPVKDRNGMAQAEFHGAMPVITTPRLTETIVETEGMELGKAAEGTGIEKEYDHEDLDEEEFRKLKDSCELVSLAVTVRPSEIRIVDFDDCLCLGLHIGGQVFIARKILERPLWKVIEVVCHEAMHLVGGDGSRAHMEAQTSVLCKVIASLWGEKEEAPDGAN